MTLDEKISHEEKVAENIKDYLERGHCNDTEMKDEYIKYYEEHLQLAEWLKELKELKNGIDKIEADRNRLRDAIKALSADIKICQKSITDKNALIGFNMAVAICNKHLSESEVEE